MSDLENAKDYAVTLSGDWWWIAAHIRHMLDTETGERVIYDLDPLRWEEETTIGSMILKGVTGRWGADQYVLFLAISGSNGKTAIQYSEAFPHFGFWETVIEKATLIAQAANTLQRQASAPRFEELLVQFYAARGRKESPKLSEMARAAGVSYTALRQYKVKYDKRLKGKL